MNANVKSQLNRITARSKQISWILTKDRHTLSVDSVAELQAEAAHLNSMRTAVEALGVDLPNLMNQPIRER